MMTIHSCNLGKSWYCPITKEICNPMQNCPVARFRTRVEQKGILADSQKDERG